ncbi:MAG: hypothetical protein IT372_38410 [Polyangiaceae bacterium]|nr:hypothetical protein [Polyangiaceae bacterium]
MDHSGSILSQLAALARVLSALALRRAAPVAAPLYFGLFLVGSVLFGPSGLRAADVTRAAIGSPPVAVALFAAWLLFTAPAARAVLDRPSTFLLRALPVPRWQFVLVTGAHLALLELPWIALWARGDGPLAALAAGATAAGAHGLLFARSARPRDLAAAALRLAAAARPGVLHRSVIACAAAPAGVAAGWLRAPERSTRRRSLRMPSSPPAALAAAHLIAITRTESAALLRAVLLAALGGLAAPLAARGHDLTAPASISALSLGIAAWTLSLAGGGIAAAALRAERAKAWLLDSTGAGGALRVLAASGAAAAACAALGLIHGAVATAGLGAGPLLAARLSLLTAALGAAVGVLAAWQSRRAAADGARRGGRDLARRAAAAGLSIAAIAALGEPAVALIELAALALAASSSRRAAALTAPRRARTTTGSTKQ